MKKRAILVGPCIGEMYWEFARFVPHIIWKRKYQLKDEDVDFVVLTRPDRFDMYGQYVNVMVPLRIDESLYKQDCYRLQDFPNNYYDELLRVFRNQFSHRYKIIEHVYPKIGKWDDKNQYPKNRLNFEYLPRKENYDIITKEIPNHKPIVVLAPRFRSGVKRNWGHWQTLYDLIYSNEELMNNFTFVICGKNPDCVPDNKERFYDINNLPNGIETSLIGYTIEIMRRSCLTVGSQSAIPNISLLFGVEALEWGHQKYLHTQEYNIMKTKVTFFDDPKYSIDPNVIFKEMTKILKRKRIKK